MRRELKASVLAKCQSDWDSYTHIYDQLVWFNSGGWYDVRNKSKTIRLACKESIAADDDIWPVAAQILGIQESKPETRPPDALLWEAFTKGRVSAQSTVRHATEFYNEWLATMQKSSNALEQGTNTAGNE